MYSQFMMHGQKNIKPSYCLAFLKNRGKQIPENGTVVPKHVAAIKYYTNVCILCEFCWFSKQKNKQTSPRVSNDNVL